MPDNEGEITPDDVETAVRQGTISANEVGEMTEVPASGGASGDEVVVGEIPAPEDARVMVWTARCSDPAHDLFGHFETRELAEQAKQDHLVDHGR